MIPAEAAVVALQVDTGVDFAFGPVAPLLGLGVTVLAALAPPR